MQTYLRRLGRKGVKFAYDKATGVAGSVEIFPTKVVYTDLVKGPRSADSLYVVEFGCNTGRIDAFTSARSGFPVLVGRTLGPIDVSLGSQKIRTYKLNYTTGDFSKTLLANVEMFGTKNDLALYRHGFDYQKAPRDVLKGTPAYFSSAQVWVSGFTSSNESESHLDFDDIDGDGHLDQVLKGTDQAQAFAKLSTIGTSNLLVKVTRPQGGSFNPSYGRSGNYVGTASSAQKADGAAPMKLDMPQNQWVLERVDINDGRQNRYCTMFDYDLFDQPTIPSGNYDRKEREDYGFAHVRTVRGCVDGGADGATAF